MILEGAHNADALVGMGLGALRTVRPVPIIEWAEENVKLNGSEAWDYNRGRLLEKWYRVAQARLTGVPDPQYPGAHLVQEVYLICATGIAKTTWQHTVLAYCAANAPRRMGIYMRRKSPDLKSARDAHLRPMFERVPRIAAQLPRSSEARKKAFGNDFWNVGGWSLHFRCGSVLDDWRAEHFELLVLDEFERYPELIDGQYRPLRLADGRQRPYGRTRFRIGGTSPGSVTSHGWTTLGGGTHERLLAKCLSCGGMQYLDHRQIVLSEGELATAAPYKIKDGKIQSRFACKWCGELLDAADVRAMVSEAVEAQRWCPGKYHLDDEHPTGVWQPYAKLHPEKGTPEESEYIRPSWGRAWTAQAGSIYGGTELSELASFLAVAQQGNWGDAQTIFTEHLAEPYISPPEEETSVEDLAETAAGGYKRGMLTAATVQSVMLVCDQQGNQRDKYNWPWVAVAIGKGGETWRIDMGREFRGLNKLTELTERIFNINGVPHPVDWTVVDCANGNALADLYLWASDNPRQRMLIRGDTKIPAGINWEEVRDSKRRKTNKPVEVMEFRINADYWADELWERIQGRGLAWHAPDADDNDKQIMQYYRSLTSEHPVETERHIPGRGKQPVRAWVPRERPNKEGIMIPRKDNHWFRCEIYGCAALEILGLTNIDDTAAAGYVIPADEPMPRDDAWDDGLSWDW